MLVFISVGWSPSTLPSRFLGPSLQGLLGSCLGISVSVHDPGGLWWVGPHHLTFSSGCRKGRSAKGGRSFIFVFGTLSVTFWSLFLMLLSLFRSQTQTQNRSVYAKHSILAATSQIVIPALCGPLSQIATWHAAFWHATLYRYIARPLSCGDPSRTVSGIFAV